MSYQNNISMQLAPIRSYSTRMAIMQIIAQFNELQQFPHQISKNYKATVHDCIKGLPCKLKHKAHC